VSDAPPLLDWQFMARVAPELVTALPLTLQIAAVSLALALLVGLATALVRLSAVPGLSQLGALYVSFTRGTPLLVQIYLSYYGLPKLLDHLQARHGWAIDVSGIPAIAYIYFAFTLNVGAYSSETIRAAIQAVDRGQMEAALSIGMTRLQALRRIVLPQAFTVALPSFGNTAIALVKDTSLAFLVSVVELMGKAKILGARGFQFFEVYVVAALVYWAVCLVIERLVAALERRVRRYEGARPA
jgi:His/Glu/Gln/Arg/opine family amino acid ABC transporter permease subunit